MNYIILDTEFNKPAYSRLNVQEIIEIGAVKLNDKLQNVGAFKMFIKPHIYLSLNKHVGKITQITNEDLKYTVTFVSVLKYFRTWVNENEEHIFCCWGYDDIREIQNNCKYYNISYNWFKPWFNIQDAYMKLFNLEKNPSLKDTVAKHNIQIDDPFHRALNDSFYTAKIFLKYFNDFIPRINELVENRYVTKRTDIRQIQLKKSKLRVRCPKCGRFIKPDYKGLVIKNSLYSIGRCIKCNNYILSNVFIKEGNDKQIEYQNFSNIINKQSYKQLEYNYLNRTPATCVRQF